MSKLLIYNSLSGKKEEFKPVKEGYVGMYVCGPTVYSNVHMGNVRTFISFDFIYRTLKYLGYKVRYVRNITDAGHLTDDGNVENDRFVKQSRLEKLEPMEIVQKYTTNFHQVLRLFNNLPPTIEPTATGHIIEQIELTQKLIEQGFAYQSNGSVYFDVLEYNKRGLNYGELSNRNIEELLSNTRDLDGQGEKKNPQDFALWKKASPAHIMRWNSPWGEGFPGWHLECTVMSTKYLGEEFDIHGGGMDLKFPHHECEIAQAKASNGHRPVRYWMHTNMLTMNGQKMSKSTGNTILPMELISGENKFFRTGFDPAEIRFFFLQAHYRSIIDMSDQALVASQRGYNRLMDAVKSLNEIKTQGQPSQQIRQEIEEWKRKCDQALLDDFNSPVLISVLFDVAKKIFSIKNNDEKISEDELNYIKQMMNVYIFDVLGLSYNKRSEGEQGKLDRVLKMLIQMRKDAREERNWTLSDKIRDELAEIGIQLKDGKDGTTYSIES